MKHETATEPLRFETFEAYLDWEVQQPIRYELHNGAVVALAGASELHNAIADNVLLLLNQHYGARGRCRAFRADMKLRVGQLKSRYPDIVVTCEQPGNRMFFDDARLVVEVISPDYASKDRARPVHVRPRAPRAVYRHRLA